MPTDIHRMSSGTHASAFFRHCVESSLTQRATLLCDIDGVLVDSVQSTITSYVSALRSEGIQTNYDHTRQAVWGKTWEEAVQFLRLDVDTAARVHEKKLATVQSFTKNMDVV